MANVTKRNLIENNIHLNWWTALLALPVSQETAGFEALRRVWADPTINTVFVDDGGILATKTNRGFYRKDSEDHLMVCLFENWAAMPTCDWVAAFISACGAIPAGEITAVGWSYEYTQDRPKKKPGKLTADIVLFWKDQEGDAVLVLETKKPGNRKWAEKDMPSFGVYLDVPGFDDIDRRYACMIISDEDMEIEKARLVGEPALSWETLAEMQMSAFKKLDLDESLKAFMIGAVIHQYASYGISPKCLPIDWLNEQPSAIQLKEVPHDGKIRRSPLWRNIRQVSQGC